ncbi:MAG: HlyC/CorC family transporter [Chloroflexi bacterium]|nr:MAG: HlyC/CorC family transporter [Chloroflexota bacterium]
MIKLLSLTVGLTGAAFVAGALAGEPLPNPLGLIGPMVVILMLVILNGLFVAAEFALIGVRPTQMEEIANQGNRTAASFLSILRSPDRQKQYIATAQTGITLVSIGLGMYGEPQLAHFVEPYLARLLGLSAHDTLVLTVGYISSVSLLTYLHIVVGEMVPKSLTLFSPDKAALLIAPFMRLSQTIFWPAVNVLNETGKAVLALIRVPPAEGHARLHSPEELVMIVEESAEGGALNPAEEEIIRNILDFADRQVHQVMTPRPKIQAIAADVALPDLLNFVANSHYSRFPVYENDLDHIIGTIHIKDVVHQYTRLKGQFDIRLLLRPVHIVPEHYPVNKLLTAFKRGHYHLAVVLDEFGGTAGIVTLEDLLEEIVGEVRDEFDVETEPLVHLGPGVLEVTGSYLLEDLAEEVNLGATEDLPDVETVGGLIMTLLGRLPQKGDTVDIHGVRLTVLAVDGLAVGRAKVEFPPETA